jgi:hypothetical protein
MKTVVVKKIIVAKDGKEFESRIEALNYERNLKAKDAVQSGLVAIGAETSAEDFLELVSGLDEKTRVSFINALKYLTVEQKRGGKKTDSQTVAKQKTPRKPQNKKVTAE